MKKRLIALILASLFALSLASCGRGGDGVDSGKESVPDSVTGSAAEEDDGIAEYVRELADEYDVRGKTFTYCGHQVNFPTAEKEQNEILSDSLYYRQRDLVDVFGIDWQPAPLPGGEDTKDAVINSVTAGDDSYDLVCGGMLTCGQALLNAGVLQRVDSLDHVDLDREWWVQSLRDTFSVKGKLYFLIGSIVPYTYLDTHCVLFNKSLTGMFGIDDDSLYEASAAGNWTLDEMQRVAAAVPTVTNKGTGIYRFVNRPGVAFLFAAGMKITKFEEDGTPYIETTLPIELSDLSDKVCSFLADDGQTAFGEDADDFAKKFGVDNETQLFIGDRALFFFADTGDIMYLRTQSVQFGILPMPKASASQADYGSYSNPWVGHGVYLPKSVKDRELSDLMAEAMAALSQKHVKTAYYDKMLRSQAIFDLQSQSSLDIIFRTKVYDMAVMFSNGDGNSMGPFLECIDKSIGTDNSTFASGYKGNAKMTNVLIKSLVKMVDADD